MNECLFASSFCLLTPASFAKNSFCSLLEIWWLGKLHSVQPARFALRQKKAEDMILGGGGAHLGDPSTLPFDFVLDLVLI